MDATEELSATSAPSTDRATSSTFLVTTTTGPTTTVESRTTTTGAALASPSSTTAAPPSSTTTTAAPTTTLAPQTTTTAAIATTPSTTSAPTTTSPPPPSSTTTSTAAPPPTTTTPPLDTGDVSGFDIISARLDGRTLLLALADTSALQSRGLMGVESMGALDGMVFVWEDPRPVSFWMKDTLIPLQIGFFDSDGVLFQVLHMTPCVADPCPTYPSEGPVRFALEARPGFFDGVAVGAALTLGQTVAQR